MKLYNGETFTYANSTPENPVARGLAVICEA